MIDRILNALGPVAGPRIARALTRPLPALALYTVALAGWHLPPAYSAALEVHAWHVTEHLVLLGTSVLAWWPVLSASRVAPRIPYGAQILYLFVFGMPMTVVAAMVTTADEVLYPFYAAAPRITPLTPLEDQRLGGLLMWVPAGLIPLAAFTVVFFKWVQSERQEDEPGAVDAQPGASTHGPATSGKTAAASR